jgi:hypothetical protein
MMKKKIEKFFWLDLRQILNHFGTIFFFLKFCSSFFEKKIFFFLNND